MNKPCYYRVSVKGIVVNDGRFLLARESSGAWDTLGGGLEHSEDPLAGLRREIHEETGLDITWVSPTPKYFLTSPRRGKPNFIANVVYEVKLKNMDFESSDECQELRFFTPEEALRLTLQPGAEQLAQMFDPGLHMQ